MAIWYILVCCTKKNLASLLRNKLRAADAVVFHGEDLGGADTLKELKTLKKFRQAQRASGQKAPIFVYFMKEPPHQVGHRVFLPSCRINAHIEGARGSQIWRFV
jgi:hypothetical protein